MDLKSKIECINNKPKKQRSTITLEEKLKIIRMYEDGKIISTIARDIKRPVSTVNTIVKDKVRLVESMKDAVTLKSTIITKRRQGPFSEMEKLLSQWINEMTQRQIPLTFSVIQEKAKSLYKDLLDKAGITATECAFKASAGWFDRFKKRTSLHSNGVKNELPSTILTSTKTPRKFPEFLTDIIMDGGYLPEQILNVQETALYWKRMPRRTFIAEEEKNMPGFRFADDRVTIMIGGNASGDLKLKPFAVYHSQKPRSFKNINLSRLPLIWKFNSNAWVTRDLFIDWFKEYFTPQVKEYCIKKGIAFKILLLLNRGPGHPEELDNFHKDIKVIYLPPRTAPMMPIDQGAVATFKACYLQHVFSAALKRVGSNEEMTLRQFWKNYNILDAIKNIATAWHDVKQTTMNNVWKTLCPEMVQDYSNEGELQVAIDTCLHLARQLELQVDYRDMNELLLGHTDEELASNSITHLETLPNAMKIETQNSGPKKFTSEGLAEAFNLIDMALAKLGSMDPDSKRFENVSRRIQSNLSNYKTIYDQKNHATTQSSLDTLYEQVLSSLQ